MWQQVLTNLTCVRETSGSGDDEVVALFRVDGIHPETGATVTQVVGLTAEDCSTGTVLLSGTIVNGIDPIGSLEFASQLDGVAVSVPIADGFPTEFPRLPITIMTIGLEIDGSDSAREHGRDYIGEFARTGTVDPTVGVDDDVLWGLSWRVHMLPDGSLDATNPTQIFADPALGGTFAATWRNTAPLNSLRQVVSATNSDQSSTYSFTIECVQA